MAERVQKLLARAGIAARRKAEELIVAGRVRVDGRIVTELGVRAEVDARIEVDGKRVMAEPLVYVLLHKPRGVVCTLRDPEGRPSVAALVKNLPVRLVPVGRLDFATSGALLLTNDGEFAAGLAHPKRKIDKVYIAKVAGVVDESALERWKRSIVIDGRATRPAAVRLMRTEGGKSWLHITLQEGRNRQIRRLGEAAGFPVMRLSRESFAGFTVEDLSPGQYRMLTVDELRDLRDRFGVPRRARPAAEHQLASRRAAKLGPRLEPSTPRSRRAGAKGRVTGWHGGIPGQVTRGSVSEDAAPQGTGRSGPRRDAPGEPEARSAKGPRGKATGGRPSSRREEAPRAAASPRGKATGGRPSSRGEEAPRAAASPRGKATGGRPSSRGEAPPRGRSAGAAASAATARTPRAKGPARKR